MRLGYTGDMMRHLGRVIILVLVFGLGFYAGDLFSPDSVKDAVENHSEEARGTVVSMVDFDENRMLSNVEVGWDEGMTVFDVLQQQAEARDWQLDYKDYGEGMGVLVSKIDGMGGEDGRWWQFWVNGTYSQVGASSVVLNPGDVIVWKLTNQEEN